MTLPAERFVARCNEAAERFLQTVVVIDNEADYGGRAAGESSRTAQRARTGLLEAAVEAAPAASAADAPAPATSPTITADTALRADAEASEPATVPGPASSGVPDGAAVKLAVLPAETAVSHKLAANTLTEAFCDSSILCTIYNPTQSENMIERAAKIASHADIVVVDWHLERGSSAKAKEIIAEILRRDAGKNGRLRLIVVYTAQSDLPELAKDLLAHLTEHLPLVKFKSTDGTTLSAPGVRVAFLQKAGGGTARPVGSISEEEIPGRLIQEFAKLNTGILPMIALQSIAAIREASHHVLATFHPGLDAAFVVHRCLLRNPEDAEAFAIELIASELGTVLRVEDIGGTHANFEIAKDWMATIEPDNGRFSVDAKLSIPAADFHLWLERGTGASVGIPRNIDVLATALYGDGDRAHARCLEFSRISNLKREAYGHRSVTPRQPPVLRLGTIVRPLTDEATELSKKYGFLICTQPACDCVRIGGERSFPFQLIARNSSSFNAVVKLKDETDATLLITGSPHLTEMHRFQSVSHQQDFVIAVSKDGRYIFEDVEKRQFEWLADLKELPAQWAASQLGSRVNSVGLNQFEWLRRKGERKH